MGIVFLAVLLRLQCIESLHRPSPILPSLSTILLVHGLGFPRTDWHSFIDDTMNRGQPSAKTMCENDANDHAAHDHDDDDRTRSVWITSALQRC